MESSYIALVRPKQWLKNAFVFAPLIFAKELFLLGPFIVAVKAFVAFCLTASAIYIINDVADLEADRAHPLKKNRPLAAGRMTIRQAMAVLVLLLVLDVAVVFDMKSRFAAILAVYFVLNIAYSWKLKEVVLLDVFAVAAGFMFRMLGGAFAIDVEVSNWLVLCSLFISLFLGFAKRRGELVQVGTGGSLTERKVLQLYRVDFVDQMLTIAAAGTVISYALYTMAPRTIDVFGTERLIYTTVFVVYGIFRYLYLVHTTPAIENPANAVTADLPIMVTGLLWITSCVVLIYFRSAFPWLQ